MKQEPMSYIVRGKRGRGHDGRLHPLFEARRELICVRCRRPLAKGEHFTKQQHPTLKHGNIKSYPCCANCYPFTYEDYPTVIATALS